MQSYQKISRMSAEELSDDILFDYLLTISKSVNNEKKQ